MSEIHELGANYLGYHADETDYKFDVVLDNNGVPFAHVKWCKNNCIEHWGWYFSKDRKKYGRASTAILRFESREEAIRFKLSCF